MTQFDEFHEQLRARLAPWFECELRLARTLFCHYELLAKWNRRLNLTRDIEMRRAIERHYAECVWFWHMRPVTGNSVVDVGSGAGFPGVVIAAMSPGVSVKLVESHGRKSVFLREATRELANVEVLAERAESIDGHFDVLVSRAVAWKDLMKLVPGLSGELGLLVGEQDGAGIRESGAFHWREPIRLPWGERRIALWGHVPRGT